MEKLYIAVCLFFFLVGGCSSIIEDYTKVPDGMTGTGGPSETDNVSSDTNEDAGDTRPSDTDTADTVGV